jgi:putative membrane protein
MYKYIYFGAAAMVVMTIFQLFNIFTYKPSTKIKYGYLLFCLPILLGLFLSPRGLNADAVEGRGLEGILRGNTDVFNDSSTGEKIYDETKLSLQRKEYIVDNEVIVNNDNYYKAISDIYQNLSFFKDRKIKVQGFVFKGSDFSSDEFVAARMLINCCAADAQVIGFLCKFDSNIDLKKDMWVEVVGHLQEYPLSNNSFIKSKGIPVIIVDGITEIQEPKEKYIYPQ